MCRSVYKCFGTKFVHCVSNYFVQSVYKVYTMWPLGFDLDQIKILVTTLRVVATDKATMKFDQDQVQQLSTMVGDLVTTALEVSKDEEEVKNLDKLKSLLQSDRWLQTLTKPIK
jgi:hypothetical protein